MGLHLEIQPHDPDNYFEHPCISLHNMDAETQENDVGLWVR